MDKDIVGVEEMAHSKIFVKIKEKREKQARLSNENKVITKFKIGEKVLIRTYYQSDAIQKRIDKFYIVDLIKYIGSLGTLLTSSSTPRTKTRSEESLM